MTISMADALRAQQACYEKAQELGVEGVICIMDDRAHVISELRMDGAFLAAIEITERKAYTTAMNRLPSEFFATFTQPEGSLFGLTSLAGGRYTIIAGGLPVYRNGVCVGSVGFSGGAPEQDAAIAKAGVEALQSV